MTDCAAAGTMPKGDERIGVSLDEPVRVSIREFLERVIDERDRLYDIRFKAAEVAVNAALAAAEKQTSASFLASEKAIVKAEEAQREYNIRSNEFRGQLDDQAKTLMPRPETLTLFKSHEDKLASMRSELDSRLSAYIVSVERALDEVKKDINGLRESRSEGGGRQLGETAMWGYVVGAAGFILTLGSIILLVLKLFNK
jgi:DNA primase large subunit